MQRGWVRIQVDIRGLISPSGQKAYDEVLQADIGISCVMRVGIGSQGERCHGLLLVMGFDSSNQCVILLFLTILSEEQTAREAEQEKQNTQGKEESMRFLHD